MARRRAATGVVGLASLLLLAGCDAPASTQNRLADPLALGWYPPWTLSQSPEGIALRWYPDATSSVMVNHISERHCRSWAKSTELASDTRNGSAEIARYRCR